MTKHNQVEIGNSILIAHQMVKQTAANSTYKKLAPAPARKKVATARIFHVVPFASPACH